MIIAEVENRQSLMPRETRFATTQWPVVMSAAITDAEESFPALEQLCRTYWFPIYAYFRRRGCGPDDARDLTQELFQRLLENRGLKSVDCRKGRFRSFLLAAANHLLANEREKLNAQRRGGGTAVAPLDDAEQQFQSEPVDQAPSEAVFDRRWAAGLLARGVAALEEDYQRSGKGAHFITLNMFLTENGNEAQYAAAGASIGMTAGAVAVAVFRMRQRYREVVRAEIARTVSQPSEVKAEMRYLLQVLMQR